MSLTDRVATAGTVPAAGGDRTVLAARAVAAVMSLSTFGFLFRHDSWRSDNLFLVPDLLLCAGLLAAAAMPRRAAVPALVIAFGAAAGVLATSVSSYAVDGRLGGASLVGAVVSLGAAVALARGLSSRSGR